MLAATSDRKLFMVFRYFPHCNARLPWVSIYISLYPLPMLKPGIAIATFALTLTAQITLPVAADPQKTRVDAREEIYIGVFGEGQSYARDIYLLPNTIRSRGDLKRFQTHDVYGQEQESGLGYSYIQVIRYQVANCREGLTGVQKAIFIDKEGTKVSKSVSALQFQIPDPDTINERLLDFVCDSEN